MNAFSKARRWLSVSTVPPDLRRDHDDGLGEPVLERGAHEVGVGGVEHDELDAGGAADHLGRQRGAAHAAEHDPGQAPLAASSTSQRRRSRLTSARDASGRATQASRLPASSSAAGPHRVASWAAMPAGDPVGDQLLDGAGEGVLVGVAEEQLERRSGPLPFTVFQAVSAHAWPACLLHLARHGLDAARSRTSRTCRRPPARGRRARRRSRCRRRPGRSITCCASVVVAGDLVAVRSRRGRRTASMVFSGMVLTVSATTSSVTYSVSG